MKSTQKTIALVAIYASVISNGIQNTILFPFAADMVRTLGGTENRSSTGTWVGVLASSLMFTRALSSPVFGVICDRVGRKPVLVLGLVVGSVCPILFGLAQSLYWALLARLLQGLLSPILVVAKTLVGELCPGPEQAKAMTVFTLSFNGSFVLGTVLGGLLANPEKSGLVSSGLLTDYPYLLPNLIPSAICFVTLFLVLKWVPETLKKEAGLIQSERRSVWKILKDSDVILTQAMYFAICAIETGSGEVFVLWLYANKADGGFAFDPKEIGIVLAIAMVGMIIVQKLYMDCLFKKCSLLTICKSHWIARVASLALLPLASVARFSTGVLPISILVAVYLLLTFTHLPIISVSLVFSNNSVVNQERGRLNGISMTLGSLARAISPLIFGAVFSVTARSQWPFPFNFAASFELLAVLSIGSFCLACKLPDSIQSSKEDIAASEQFELSRR